jgi:hypothetical protein
VLLLELLLLNAAILARNSLGGYTRGQMEFTLHAEFSFCLLVSYVLRKTLIDINVC